MSAKSFLDTNIFVYQLERLDTRKADIADALILDGIDSRRIYTEDLTHGQDIDGVTIINPKPCTPKT